MPGCVQTMVSNGIGYADPLINRAKPIITQTRKDYKRVDDALTWTEKKVEECVPPLIKKMDDSIDSIPPADEVYTKIKDTISEAPELIQNNESVKKATSFVTASIEPTCHTMLDKFLDEDKNATVWERIKTIPMFVYAFFLAYAKIALTKSQEYAALAWAQMLVWFQWSVDILSVQMKSLLEMEQVKSVLEMENVKYYKEQLCSTGSHFYAEYKVLIPKKVDELKERAANLSTVAIAKIPEARQYAVDKGLPVEKFESVLATAKTYAAMGVKQLPTKVTTTLEELPVIGRIWLLFLSLLGEEFHDAASDQFKTPTSQGESEKKSSPPKKSGNASSSKKAM